MPTDEHKELISQSRKFLANKLDDPDFLAELELMAQETGKTVDELKKRLMGK